MKLLGKYTTVSLLNSEIKKRLKRFGVSSFNSILREDKKTWDITFQRIGSPLGYPAEFAFIVIENDHCFELYDNFPR
jgi:hypothetical protein